MNPEELKAWALPCLFREIIKEFPDERGDFRTVSRWALKSKDLTTPLPLGEIMPQTALYWIKKYFLPYCRRHKINHPAIEEIRRRIVQFQRSETTSHATQTPRR